MQFHERDVDPLRWQQARSSPRSLGPRWQDKHDNSQYEPGRGMIKCEKLVMLRLDNKHLAAGDKAAPQVARAWPWPVRSGPRRPRCHALSRRGKRHLPRLRSRKFIAWMIASATLHPAIQNRIDQAASVTSPAGQRFAGQLVRWADEWHVRAVGRCVSGARSGDPARTTPGTGYGCHSSQPTVCEVTRSAGRIVSMTTPPGEARDWVVPRGRRSRADARMSGFPGQDRLPSYGKESIMRGYSTSHHRACRSCG